MRKLLDRLASWVAWKLPRSVVHHAVIRAWAHATVGPHSKVETPAVTVDDAVRRWNAAS